MSCFRVNKKLNENDLSICIKKTDIINNNYSKTTKKQLKCNNKKLTQTFKNLKENLYNLDECIICISETVSADELCILKCNHTYHKICIDKWLSKQKTCPICMITI